MGKEINTESLNLSSILYGKHYSIDYYQRDYTWGEKEIDDLLEDLLSKFEISYKAEENFDQVQNYSQYFLGTYVLSNGEYIIDGQQRLTSLTLLFLYIYMRSKKDNVEIQNIKGYISSDHFGKDEYNISVSERDKVLDFILKERESSAREEAFIKKEHMYLNYNIIKSTLDKKIVDSHMLKTFFYWISQCVFMIKISTEDSQEAYTIFETMNDRGKSLTPLEMTKGWLLSQVDDEEREEAVEIWERISTVLEDRLEEFLVAFLQAKYVDSYYAPTRGKKGWLYIQDKPHRWLKDESDNIGLSRDPLQFLKSLNEYVNIYKRIIGYQEKFEKGFENVYYLNNNPTSYDELLYLCVIDEKDSNELIDQKLKVVSQYLYIRYGIKSWENKLFDKGTKEALQFLKLFREIRSLKNKDDIDKIIWFFYKELEHEFPNGSFSENMANKDRISGRRKATTYFFLRGLTTFIVDIDSGHTRNILPELIKNYQIEHILAQNYEHNSEYFESQEELDNVRNEMGDLGFLPKSVNNSLNNISFSNKVDKYPQHDDLLLGFLSKEMYKDQRDPEEPFKNRPNLNKFVKSNTSLQGLIEPQHEFKKEDIRNRTKMLLELAKILWNKKRLLELTSKKCRDFEELEQLLKDKGYELEVNSILENQYEEAEEDFEDEDLEESNTTFKEGEIYCFRKNGKDIAMAKCISKSPCKIIILEFKNAPKKEIFKKSALNNLSSSVDKAYNEIQKNATAGFDDEHYNWEGEITISPSVGSMLCTGINTGNNLWVQL